MVNGSTNTALRQVARVFRDGTLIGLSDRQMLERFVANRDEAAFEVLVARHGPMVFNVCKQLLRDPHDVEDAFQAVFLVLVRKAGMIRVEGSLGPWLYTVAQRVAARARANRRRIATREAPALGELAATPSANTLDRDETAAAIQEELGRLPDRLRAPLVLCYLQGMTHELVASQIGCPVGTIRSRLSRGRARLLDRITRRGLTLSAAALVSALELNVRAAAVPPVLRAMLIRLATEWAPETAATAGAPGASASVAALLEGVSNVMRIKKLAIAATVLIGVGALGLVTADRAAAVGGAQLQESAPSSSDPFKRRVGPDGRPIGSLAAEVQSETRTLTKTYYVGDILDAMRHAGSGPVSAPNPDGEASGGRQKVDFDPLINLLIATVAPGTWENQYVPHWAEGETEEAVGNGVSDRDNAIDQTKPKGSIIPFHLSISLIVKCTPEVHQQVTTTLRELRHLVFARRNPVFDKPATRFPRIRQAAPGDQTLPAPIAPRANTTVPASRQRVQQLLDELQKEIQKLPPNIDTRDAPVQ